MLAKKVYGQSTQVQQKCVQSHWFQAFLAAFPKKSLSSFAPMPIIDWIRCKLENKTEAYIYALSMFSESFFAGNQSVFEDFNIIQMGINK